MPRKSSVALWHLIVLLAFSIVLISTLSAQVMQGPTTIRQSVHHDLSLPLSEMVKTAPPPDLTIQEAEEMKLIPLPPGLPTLTEDPVRQAMDLVATPSPPLA